MKFGGLNAETIERCIHQTFLTKFYFTPLRGRLPDADTTSARVTVINLTANRSDIQASGEDTATPGDDVTTTRDVREDV